MLHSGPGVFKDKKSTVYLEAIRALKQLEQEEGHDAVLRVAAQVIQVGRKAWLSKKWKGLSSQPCLGKVGDGRHRHNLNDSCPQLPGADHTEMIKTETGAYLYVTEPYGLSWDNLRDMVEMCQERRLAMSIEARLSTHFPGETLAIIVTRDHEPQAMAP